jgi:LacI family transcriptional regulator
MKRVTLDDVARLAGVSPATVSRVINDHINIRGEVRERVRRVIEETGYQPNVAARSLASNRSSIIGLIIPSGVQFVFTDYYLPVLIQGISQACNSHDYTLSLFLFQTLEEERRSIQRIAASGLIDGFIVTADVKDTELVSHLLAARKPFIQIGRPQDADLINFVDVENITGAYTGVAHLIQTGHQRIATIATKNNTAGVDRLAGYRKALVEHGIAIDNALIAYGDWTEESGYAAMQKLLNRKPDAVFASTDTMALGALRAIKDADLEVPHDIAIVGFDDAPIAVKANPPLTTIKQPTRQVGRVAVETLIDILQSESDTPRHIILPSELIIRASSYNGDD